MRRQVRGDQRRLLVDAAAVAEPEVEREAAHDHDVGLLERRAAVVAELQLVRAAEQAARGAGEEHRRAEHAERAREPARILDADQRLAADDDHRPLRRS